MQSEELTEELLEYAQAPFAGLFEPQLAQCWVSMPMPRV